MKRYVILIILFILLIFGLFAFYKAFSSEEPAMKRIFSTVRYKSFKAGDIVSFNDEDWYVLYQSSNKDNYVTLIYKGILYLEDDNLAYTDYKIYESSSLNKYLKNDYANILGNKKLREINGYKVRLFNSDDLRELIRTEYDSNTDSYKIIDCPDYICLTNVSYATMIPTVDGNYDVSSFDEIDLEDYEEYQLHLSYYNLSTTYDTAKLESIVDDASLFVRPIINVYKERLDE